MVEACARVVEYTTGLSAAGLRGDHKTIDAVVRNLEVLGEAAKRVPAAVRSKAPDVPWRDEGTNDHRIKEQIIQARNPDQLPEYHASVRGDGVFTPPFEVDAHLDEMGRHPFGVFTPPFEVDAHLDETGTHRFEVDAHLDETGTYLFGVNAHLDERGTHLFEVDAHLEETATHRFGVNAHPD